MAGVGFHVPSNEVSLSATTAKTVLQVVAASNHRIKISGWGVAFKGTSPTDTPVRVRLLRQTTAGTMSSATVVKNNDADDETLQVTAQYNATAEPTAGDVIKTIEVHPQAGYAEILPFGQEIIVKGGGRLGIECYAAAAQTVAAWFDGEE